MSFISAAGRVFLSSSSAIIYSKVAYRARRISLCSGGLTTHGTNYFSSIKLTKSAGSHTNSLNLFKFKHGSLQLTIT